MRPLAEMIEDVVELVREDVLAEIKCKDDYIQTINYQYGSLVEIRQTLKQWDEDKEKKHEKYPCIFLILDTPEQIGLSNTGYNGRYRCTIGIVHHTEDDYTADERYKNVIKPILYPIYESFVANLLDSGLFVGYDVQDTPHTKIDRVNMGKGAFLQLDEGSYDYLDAVELNNLQLVPAETNCLTTNQKFR